MDTIKRVEELAAQHNLTIYQLSQLCGISFSTIQTAKRRGGQLKIDTIERICQALELPLSKFFESP